MACDSGSGTMAASLWTLGMVAILSPFGAMVFFLWADWEMDLAAAYHGCLRVLKTTLRKIQWRERCQW